VRSHRKHLPKQGATIMRGLAHAKAAMLAARTKDELRQTTAGFCFTGRFSFSDDLSYSENAYIATRQNENSVAELLRYADEIAVRL